MKSSMKKYLTAAAIVAAIVVAAVFATRDNGKPEPKGKAASHRRQVERKASKASAASAKKPAEPRKKPVKRARNLFEGMDEKNRVLAESIQDALEREDLGRLTKLAEEAMKSTNTEVRVDAVDALGWFGEKALPELTLWMADPDEEVAQAAMNQWTSALSEIEKPEDKIVSALPAFSAISDPDTLETIGMEISNAADELVDEENEGEERASQNRVWIVQSLAEIITGGAEKNSAAAREAFENFTGNEWISVEEAEKYLQDPENYEAPETDGE